jgi:hypothetical protein
MIERETTVLAKFVSDPSGKRILLPEIKEMIN